MRFNVLSKQFVLTHRIHTRFPSMYLEIEDEYVTFSSQKNRLVTEMAKNK